MMYGEYEHDEPVFFNRKAKRKEVEWTTGHGEVLLLSEMEDSHLQNTINYLNRKMFEWQHTQETAKEYGVELGSMIINRRPIPEWLELMFGEVKRRQEA